MPAVAFSMRSSSNRNHPWTSISQQRSMDKSSPPAHVSNFTATETVLFAARLPSQLKISDELTKKGNTKPGGSGSHGSLKVVGIRVELVTQVRKIELVLALFAEKRLATCVATSCRHQNDEGPLGMSDECGHAQLKATLPKTPRQKASFDI